MKHVPKKCFANAWQNAALRSQSSRMLKQIRSTLLNYNSYKRTRIFTRRSLRATSLNTEPTFVRDLKHASNMFFIYAPQNGALRSESSRVLIQDGSLSYGILESASTFCSYFPSDVPLRWSSSFSTYCDLGSSYTRTGDGYIYGHSASETFANSQISRSWRNSSPNIKNASVILHWALGLPLQQDPSNWSYTVRLTNFYNDTDSKDVYTNCRPACLIAMACKIVERLVWGSILM